MTHDCDIIVFGGGIAGLFTAARLRSEGYDVLLAEKDALGGVQTLASQGMIHGGQKYTLQGKVTAAATTAAAMPERWEACFKGTGELDLSAVKMLSESQVMFPAGSFLANLFSRLTVFAAAKAVNGKTRKLPRGAFPPVLKHGPVYEMQECVLDVKSLIAALAESLKGRIFKGAAKDFSTDGHVTIGAKTFHAKTILFTAGAGNEAALKQLGIAEQRTQRRPLRQIMVRPMQHALYGHGITGEPKPRMTITSHPDGAGNYVWYLGGNVAERGSKVPEEEAISFAKKEMHAVFPDMDWDNKEWASYAVDRAEALSDGTHLAAGPCLQEYGQVLVAWPTKLTFAPLLADLVLDRLKENNITPASAATPPDLPEAAMGSYPWEVATWIKP